MVDMFSPGRIGNLKLRNRLVRSAVWEGLGDEEGFVTDKLVSYITKIVEGGVGLIILGYSYIQPNGRQSTGQTGIYSDEHVPGLKKLAYEVHKARGKISIQLVHVGPQTIPQMIHGTTPVGPSAVEHPVFGTPRELSTAEVKNIVKDFGKAGQRAVAAEFDAIQIHGAHGYLLSQFLSPLWNVRTDEYGGTPENRMRFAIEVFKSVRKNAAGLPVFIKLNLDDLIDGSTTPQDALPLARQLSEMGIDAIEVSAGGPASGKGPARTKIKTKADEGYFLDLARQTRDVTACPLMVVGGWRSPSVINKVLAEGVVDFITMGRPLIREPGLVMRWQSGDLTKAKCISCNGCFDTLSYGNGIQCMIELKRKTKKA